jgi:hypothetical protein
MTKSNSMSAEDVRNGLREIEAAAAKAPPSEQDNIVQYRKMYVRMARICRTLEKQMLREERPGRPAKINRNDVYALSTAYSQMREIIADVRTITDQSSQVTDISLTVLEPMRSSLSTLLVNVNYQLDSLIRDIAPEKQLDRAQAAIRALITDMSKYMDARISEANEGVSRVLLAPQETLPSTKRRRR